VCVLLFHANCVCVCFFLTFVSTMSVLRIGDKSRKGVLMSLADGMREEAEGTKAPAPIGDINHSSMRSEPSRRRGERAERAGHGTRITSCVCGFVCEKKNEGEFCWPNARCDVQQ